MKPTEETQQAGRRDLLEGSLDGRAARRLRREIEQESRAAKRQLDAQLRHRGLEFPGPETVPAALQQRLRAIPSGHPRPRHSRFQWGLAAAASLVLALAVAIHQRPRPDEPSAAEIAQARKELVIALAYLEAAARESGLYVSHEVGRTMQDALVRGISRGVGDGRGNG